MGSCCSSDKVEPQDVNLKEKGTRSSGQSNNSDHFGSSKNRSCTDTLFFIIMVLFLVSLIGLVLYCALNGDVYRILNGYDNCANICGRVTEPENDPRFPCKGADYTDKPFLLIKEAGRAIVNPVNVRRECVNSCSYYEGYREFLSRCIPLPNTDNVNSFFSKTGLADFLQEVAEDLSLCWEEILYICLIALAWSIVLFILFRFFVAIVIWVVLIGVVLASVVGSICLWILYAEAKNELKMEDEKNSEVDKRNVSSRLALAVVATVAAVIIILVILVMRKRIALVAQLFKEAGKALHSMPFLLLEPLLTFIALAMVVAIWLFFSVWIESSGTLSDKGNENFYYKKDGAMKFTRWYNLFGLFWFLQFVIGCQHMVIAGAVSKWFFTRNKDQLGTPILTAFGNLVRFHLGTVALGSLLIALVQIVRAILSYLQSKLEASDNSAAKFMGRCCQCCLYCFEKILQYLTRNAYIETAMYGISFCKAGRQAFKLLTSNALRVAAINSVGDFVLFLGKALVVIATVLIGFEILKTKEGIQHIWVPLLLAGLFAYLVSHCFITVYEMAIDTIFLCFCEDCEQNDGISKPYYMSRGLMEFVENSKKALAVLDSEKNRAWSGATTRSAK